MKFVCPAFDEVIHITTGAVNSIIIENGIVFRTVTSDIAAQINGEPGECVLSVNNTPVPFSKHCELLIDFADFNINTKSLVSGMISALDKTANNEDFYSKTQELLCAIENYIYDLSADAMLDVGCAKLSAAAVLKSVGLSLREDYEALPEKIIDYMLLVNELCGEKLFVTVNLRAYFSDDEVHRFFTTAINHDIRLLMLENTEYVVSDGEKRLIIDKDMCVI